MIISKTPDIHVRKAKIKPLVNQKNQLYHHLLQGNSMKKGLEDLKKIFVIDVIFIQGGPKKCPYFSLAITFTKIQKLQDFFSTDTRSL